MKESIPYLLLTCKIVCLVDEADDLAQGTEVTTTPMHSITQWNMAVNAGGVSVILTYHSKITLGGTDGPWTQGRN